jgi:hypothetical protein
MVGRCDDGFDDTTVAGLENFRVGTQIPSLPETPPLPNLHRELEMTMWGELAVVMTDQIL